MVQFAANVVRTWWLWFLPLFAPVLVVGWFALSRTPQYDVQMTLWVDPTPYLGASSSNPWITPAQAQADLFRQLMGSRAFWLRVAEGTDLAPHTTTPAGRDYLEEHLTKSLGVAPRGSQLVEISYRTSQPASGPALLESFVIVATEYSTTSTREQAKIASQFYAALLPQREKEFLDASAALRDYLARTGGSPEATFGERGLEQLELSELRRREEATRKRYEDTLHTLDQVRLQASATETVQTRGFRVVDAPYVPTKPIALRRELIVPAGIALGVTAGLALGIPLLLTWLDRSLHGRAQVFAATGLPTLGAVPWYRQFRRAGGRRGGTARAQALQPLLAGD